MFKNNIYSQALISLFIAIGFNSCGYTPAISYAKGQISKNVFVIVDVSAKNSKYTPILKDGINEIMISKFNANLVDNKNKAQTIIQASMNAPVYEALQSNKKGFVNIYRVNVVINIFYSNLVKNTHNKFTLKSFSDYNVDENSVSSQNAKDNALKLAIKKSLDNMLSNIAIGSI